MAPDVQARAFEPFFTTKGERGSGLGLAQVFGIVERHGGRISLKSAAGRGTAVRIELPIADLGEGAPKHADRAAGRRLRVLAVDDEIALARLTETSLSQDGHEVAIATSAEEAVTLLEARPFDVVLSDLGMGAGWNGWQLAEEVRRRWPGTAFVLATGWAGEIDPTTTRARGVDAVVGKPYRLADLRRVLREVSRSA
jgi:CheY-like chemotaxis protein